MNIINNKRIYITPVIERIVLDNEISLALESDPPFLPGEETSGLPQYFSNDPYKASAS